MALIAGLFGRWLNPDALKGILIALAVIVVTSGLAYWHHDTKVQAVAAEKAACDLRWVNAQVAAAKAGAEKQAQTEHEQRLAAEAARDDIRAQRDNAAALATMLESQLDQIKDNPIAWPKDVARSLRKIAK